MKEALKFRTRITGLALMIAIAMVFACGQSEDMTDSAVSSIEDPPAPEAESEVAETVLNLPVAPDFTLPAANKGSTEISLSSFQGDKEVVLVFYRAFW